MTTANLPEAPPEATTPTQMLVDASFLFVQGYPIAAGMYARAALEGRLDDLCELHDCQPSPKALKHAGIGRRIDALRKTRALDKATIAEAVRLAGVANEVVHCMTDDAAVVENLLTDVRQFLDATEEGGAS